MKRICVSLAAFFALVAASPVDAGAHADHAAHASRATTVELRHTNLGDILTTSSGFTLFEFSRDQHERNSCVSLTGCPQAWPALQTSGKPSAGPGVRASLLSTIKLPGGAMQIAYAGHPLYLYSGDSRPGETGYVGVSAFGGAWDAMGSAGNTVK
jgi:predicted lipoprotein with Yx(FWY)xxD motif